MLLLAISKTILKQVEKIAPIFVACQFDFSFPAILIIKMIIATENNTGFFLIRLTYQDTQVSKTCK